jgi:hypothetical protein
MKPDKQHTQLLDDILLDEALTDFKGKLLDQCQGELKRRRVRRYCLYAVTPVAAILLIVLILRFDIPTPPAEPVNRHNTPTYIVRTTPLLEQQIVRTAKSCETVRTQNAPLVVCSTTSDSELIVQEHYELTQVSDSEMLKLFEGVSCGIIRPQGGQSRFVFFNLEDTQRFFGAP